MSRSKNPKNCAPIAAAVATLFGLAGPALAADAPAAAASAASAPEAQEATALDAVTVRSRNRIEKLQDVPLSVSVVQGAELERLAATGIDAITKRAANVSWNLGNQRTSSISIRGIGKIGQTEAQDPSVGLIVDGVNYAYNALSSSFDFVDIDTIEVARGPQGTLLGKNTSVGVISINTKRPSFTPTSDAIIGFRQGDGVFATAAVGGPVIDNLLAWRGTFSVNRGQGDKVNHYNTDQTYTNTDRVSGRVQFLYTPTPDLSARFEADLQPRAAETTNGRTIQTPTPTKYADGSTNTLSTDAATRLARRWFQQNGGYSLQDYYAFISNDSQRGLVTGSRGATAEVNWKVAGHTLTSISAYKDYHFNAVNDEGTPFDIYRNSGGFINEYKQASQEFRITSAIGGKVDYQGGLYFIDVRNNSRYQRVWGNDAGAWFASAGQYKDLDVDGNGRYLLANSLANVTSFFNSPTGVQEIHNRSAAVFGQANWHWDDKLTVTTGLRVTNEDRSNNGRSVIVSSGSAAELNPSIVNGFVLGGFDSYINTGAAKWVRDGLVVAAGTPGAVLVAAGSSTAPVIALTTDTTDAARLAQANAQADAAAQKYFNAASWAALTPTQQRQLADAQAIRKSQFGVLFNQTRAQPFKLTQPALTLSPSYKFNEAVTGYVTYQHGEKAGISQLVNGISSLVVAEKTNAFEIGAKSVLLDRTLILNADIFRSRITNYQQSVRVVDAYSTSISADGQYVYTTATGNVPKVHVSGLEIDGIYGGIRNTTLRFSGAYNKAIYALFPNAAQPVENGYVGAAPYRDISGLPLAGAPKYTFNIGADHHYAVAGDKDLHASANIAFASSFYSDTALSAYSVIPKTTLVDGAIGLGNRNKSFDISLIVKNLFNDTTPLSKTWNSYSPALPRQFAIQLISKL